MAKLSNSASDGVQTVNFESILNQIDDKLRNERACPTALEYVEQSSWIIFLKYLNDWEEEQEDLALLEGRTYKRIIDAEYRWDEWAAPKRPDGSNDETRAMTGNDLITFVSEKLFPHLRKFKTQASDPNTLVYKVGMIFGELTNKINNGYNLRDILWLVDRLRFGTTDERHQMTVLYEKRLLSMGNAGRNGGQYYTPRPLIRTMVNVVKPRIGETVFDPACGSAGFLCEAYNYMKPLAQTIDDSRRLQERTFYGQEFSNLAYIIAVMNMIFHGIEAPNVKSMDSLSVNIMQLQPREQHDIIMANPPFGAKVNGFAKKNYPIPSSESAYLFMELFVRYLKAGGRAAIIVKNTILSNADTASVEIRRMLLDDCRLDAVLDLPQGVFTGAGVRTVVLFFTKGEPTERIWYYQLNLDRNLGKKNPLSENDLADFVKRFPDRSDSENSWTVERKDIDPNTLDLSVKNPNTPEPEPLRQPNEIVDELIGLQHENIDILKQLKEDKI